MEQLAAQIEQQILADAHDGQRTRHETSVVERMQHDGYANDNVEGLVKESLADCEKRYATDHILNFHNPVAS